MSSLGVKTTCINAKKVLISGDTIYTPNKFKKEDDLLNRQVKLYWGEDCQPCKSTKRWLDKKDIPYEAIEVTSDNMNELGIQSVPVVEVRDRSDSGGSLKESWVGFRPDKLGGLLL